MAIAEIRAPRRRRRRHKSPKFHMRKGVLFSAGAGELHREGGFSTDAVRRANTSDRFIGPRASDPWGGRDDREGVKSICSFVNQHLV